MPAINIRDFPYELHRKVRLYAFTQGKSMKSFVIKACREAVKEAEAEAETLRAKSLQKKEEKEK